MLTRRATSCKRVFLQRSLPTLRTDAPPRAWLFRVAQQRSLDTLRRKRRNCLVPVSALQGSTEDELSLWAIIPDPLSEAVAERHEVQRLFQQAIATLPPKYRAIVFLRSSAQWTLGPDPKRWRHQTWLTHLLISCLLKIPWADIPQC